jgi:septal ring factor EnvC (AmiA/AmiB activator)
MGCRAPPTEVHSDTQQRRSFQIIRSSTFYLSSRATIIKHQSAKKENIVVIADNSYLRQERARMRRIAQEDKARQARIKKEDADRRKTLRKGDSERKKKMDKLEKDLQAQMKKQQSDSCVKSVKNQTPRVKAARPTRSRSPKKSHDQKPVSSSSNCAPLASTPMIHPSAAMQYAPAPMMQYPLQ